MIYAEETRPRPGSGTTTRETIRMPALDGLRGVAALLVVVGHFFSSPIPVKNQMNRLMSAAVYFGIGNFGVVLFFCLSSFLLTFLFVKEFDKFHTNKFLWFFARRSLRIWPLYFCFLAIVNIIVYFHELPVETLEPARTYLEKYNVFLFSYLSNWLYATTVYTDTVPGNTGFLNILWSLGVEEQIYIILPFIASLLLITHQKMRIAISIILFSLVSRTIYIILCKQRLNGGMYYSTLSYTDIYFIAGLIGALYARGACEKRYRALFSKFTVVSAIGLLLICMHQFTENALAPYGLISLIIYPILGVLTSYLIVVVVTFDNNIISRVLSTQFSRACGALAYSAYIWHFIFMVFMKHYFFETKIYDLTLIENSLIFQLGYFSLYLSSVLAIACLSHGFIELPFLRIKERLSVTGGINIFSWKKYFLYSSSFSGVMFVFLWCLS